ncbi:hypothetical protein DAMA08_034560 [Martiniozyma asiatica (nom. inval.)]|nr:hypothetical protein DAMA08_034560 [Martiniozyma asiatica]
MALKIIHTVRHGYRSNWLPPNEQIEPYTGIDSDFPLAPHGIDQSHELAAHISSMKDGHKPQLIFSSPFYRCVETITPTADILDLAIHTDRGIGEWYKPGRPVIPQPADHSVMHEFFPRVPNSMIWEWDAVIPNPQGETEVEIFERCKKWWDWFIPKFESEHPEITSIILVTHAATKIALGMSLLGYSSVRDTLLEKHGGDGGSIKLGGSTCSIDTFSREFDGDWSLSKNADTSFLKSGAEMDWHYITSQFEAGSKEDIEYRNLMQQEQDKVNARQCKL